jgi:hypothetical protein
MVVLFTFYNHFFYLLTAKINQLTQSRFATMAVKVEKIAMPRRQEGVIECESVTTKSQLCNILKIYYLG